MNNPRKSGIFAPKIRNQEHIYLENENLFPRAIKMEGLEE